MEAQLNKALTIAVKVQASKKKRKADNLDDNASPPEKLQRVTDDKSLCGSCHNDVARLCCYTMIQCDDCDQWHHYVCVGIGPVMLNSSTSFAQVGVMVNDHGLPCRLLNLANSILVILLRLLISLDSVLIKSKIPYY